MFSAAMVGDIECQLNARTAANECPRQNGQSQRHLSEAELRGWAFPSWSLGTSGRIR